MKLDEYEVLLKNISIELNHFLVSRGASKDIAEDVVQDVFVKVLEMDLILPPDKIRPYMYKIAKTKYIDLNRREAHLQKILQQYLIPQQKQTREPHTEDKSKKLQRIIQKLSPGDQEILKMKYIEGQSIDEIATNLKITSPGVKMRLYRLRKKIKKGFGES